MFRSFYNFLLFLLLINSTTAFSQNDSTAPKTNRNKKIVLAASSTALAGGSLVFLSKAWYLQYNNGKFHAFNDNDEWLQMDKAGHFWSTYNSGRLMMDAFDWAGFTKKQKLMYGGTIGFAYMTCIEVMDGFSKGWGFSYGDMLANSLGCATAISQEAAWNEQRIFIKYSYHKSNYADYNPTLLGENFSQKILKDYNAQIYWVSFSPFAFIQKDTKFPKWLAISFGYGAHGMVRGKEDFITYSSNTPPIVEYTVQFDRVRDFYLSLDIDLTKIKTKSKTLKTIFTCLNTLKIPAPSIGFNKNGSTFYWLR